MAKGRPPKPIEQKKAEGNPGRRKLPEPVKVEKADTSLEPPDNVASDNVALAVWHELLPQLTENGVLAVTDRWHFAAYCRAVGRWVRADEALQQYGSVIKGHRGAPSLSPYAREANAASDAMKSLGAELGLSPVARTRLASDAPKPEDDGFMDLADLRDSLQGIDLGVARPKGEA